jgi:hypothetical protein
MSQTKKTIVVALVQSVEGVQTLTFNSYSEFKVNFGVFERSDWRLIEAKEIDFFYDLDQKKEAGVEKPEGRENGSEQPYVNLDNYFKELME